MLFIVVKNSSAFKWCMIVRATLWREFDKGVESESMRGDRGGGQKAIGPYQAVNLER